MFQNKKKGDNYLDSSDDDLIAKACIEKYSKDSKSVLNPASVAKSDRKHKTSFIEDFKVFFNKTSLHKKTTPAYKCIIGCPRENCCKCK